MIELPESHTLAAQLRARVVGRRVVRCEAARTPHKLAWYTGDPADYARDMADAPITEAVALGGLVRLGVGERFLTLSDGVLLRYLGPGERRPERHQLLLELDDESALVCRVQMYGGITFFREAQNDNPYYWAAHDAVSPLTSAFDAAHFARLLAGCDPKKISVKAFLATQQRIPGVGNGVLQDILLRAKLHPKRRMGTLDDAALAALYQSLKDTLLEMTSKGGRDTERDLYGCTGGYATLLNSKTCGRPCPVCGAAIEKGAYLGGNVYYCPQCQPR
nr:endonuclease VIII [Maliibacterium massiliense]